MNLGGLIAAGLKGVGGAAQGVAEYAKGNLEQQRKLNYAAELSKMDEEKLMRVDQVKRERDLEYMPKVGDAETGVMVRREQKMRPEKEETAKSEARGRSEGERIGLAAYANDSDAREGARAKASDARDPAAGYTYQVQKDGSIAVVKGKSVVDYLKDPTTGEKLIGSTEIDKKTGYLVQMLLLELRDPITSDARKSAIRGEINTLLGVTQKASTSPNPPPAGDSGNKPWNRNYGSPNNTASP